MLEDSIESAWAPIKIKTLRDNVGAKMNALVGRGAPRDFIDIAAAIARLTPEERLDAERRREFFRDSLPRVTHAQSPV